MMPTAAVQMACKATQETNRTTYTSAAAMPL